MKNALKFEAVNVIAGEYDSRRGQKRQMIVIYDLLQICDEHNLWSSTGLRLLATATDDEH